MRKRERKDEVLLLMGVSGEMPADWMGMAAGTRAYGAALLTGLKKSGEIKLRSKDGIRGYLLRTKAKRYLLDTYGEDMGLFLSGSGATNHVKSEPEKRLRLHRMSMVWIYFYRIGIRIFASDKPALFPGSYPFPSENIVRYKPERKSGEREWAYYGTVEWKGKNDQEISGSRACGILVADQALVVYNTMDRVMKWTPKIERNLRGRLAMRFRKSGGVPLHGAVMMGTGMEMLGRILDSDGGVKGSLYRVDETYEHIYYVPLLREAAVQIYLLCDMEGREKLRAFLRGVLHGTEDRKFRLEEGKDKKGRSVYFCYLLDLWQLKRIRGISQGGRVFCFAYQAQTVREILGEEYEVEAIRPEKVYQYLGWSEPWGR